MHSNLASHPNPCRSRREKIAKPWPLPDAAALSSMHGLPRSGNSSAQTSASLHPPAALRLRVLPFTRTWSSTVCAEEFPTPLEMSLHGLPLLRHSKSFGPSAPIAYATCVSPPDEAAAWPGAGVRWQMRLPHRGERTEGNRTVGTHHMGTQRGERTTWERTTWERTVRRILFAGFEALCVFGYLELVYHLLNLTIHKDRQVVG